MELSSVGFLFHVLLSNSACADCACICSPVKLFKGNTTVLARHSPVSLYDKDLVSMDIAGGFEPTDSEGFIKVQSIRIKAYENMLKVG